MCRSHVFQRSSTSTFCMYPTTAIPTHPPLAPAGGARGCNCTPWNLKMMTPYAVCKQNAPKLLLAPPALARISLKQGMKTQKLTKNHLFCFWRTKVRWFVSALTRMQLESYICRWVHITSAPRWKIKYFFASPPPGKISAGAHATHLLTYPCTH